MKRPMRSTSTLTRNPAPPTARSEMTESSSITKAAAWSASRFSTHRKDSSTPSKRSPDGARAKSGMLSQFSFHFIQATTRYSRCDAPRSERFKWAALRSRCDIDRLLRTRSWRGGEREPVPKIVIFRWSTDSRAKLTVGSRVVVPQSR